MNILYDSETESHEAGDVWDVQTLPRAREQGWFSYEKMMPTKPQSSHFFGGLIPATESFGGRLHQDKQSLIIADLMSSWREVQEVEMPWNMVFDPNVLETRASCRRCEFVARCFAGDFWASVAGSESSEIEEQFNTLAQRWYRETRKISSAEQMVLHPAYQQIIGMGRQALPFIFRELKRSRGHWLWALAMILRTDRANKGETFRQAVDSWLKYGEELGYI